MDSSAGRNQTLPKGIPAASATGPAFITTEDDGVHINSAGIETIEHGISIMLGLLFLWLLNKCRTRNATETRTKMMLEKLEKHDKALLINRWMLNMLAKDDTVLMAEWKAIEREL